MTSAELTPTMTEYELIIFDCDGVLVDSELLSCRCLRDQLRRHGIEIDLDAVFELFLGRSVASVMEHYRSRGHRVPETFPTELRNSVRRAFSASLEAIPNVAQVLRGLGSAYCVASSSDLDRINFSLELTGLSELFAGRIFTAQMVRRGKPAPDLFLHAAATMQAEPLRTLVIEDSVSGVQAAKAAGMTAWGFVGGSHYAARDGQALLTAAGADRIFGRMADFRPSLAREENGSAR